MCSCDNDNPPSVYREQRRTARKQHTCDDCFTPIVPGELYVYASGIWDGEPSSFALCLFCKALAKVADVECHEFGMLRECLRDCADNWPPSFQDEMLLNQLFPKAA